MQNNNISKNVFKASFQKKFHSDRNICRIKKITIFLKGHGSPHFLTFTNFSCFMTSIFRVIKADILKGHDILIY